MGHHCSWQVESLSLGFFPSSAHDHPSKRSYPSQSFLFLDRHTGYTLKEQGAVKILSTDSHHP
jgi:hypothetical protein